MNICYPDYENCITSLACSILKEFGAGDDTKPTLKMCDELFKKNYKNVVVLLLDGMGKCIIDKNLEKDGFFASHLVGTYSSVFPPTTVAATTSIDSAKNPAEHSWLGWDCYFKEIDKNVTVFLNTESGTDIPAADYYVARRYLPYERVAEKINKAGENAKQAEDIKQTADTKRTESAETGSVQAYYASPFMKPYPADFTAICARIKELCKLDGKKYIYAYWNEPDHTMHEKGCYHEESKVLVRELEQTVEKLCEELEDTLVIVTADHGHMDSKGVTLEDYPEIMECLVRLPSIEPRALNLFVKSGMEQQFEAAFQKAFGTKFLLLTKEEVKRQKLFGTGEEHAQFDGMLGDYLAVAVSDLSIYNTREEKDSFIGVHAGLTEDEIVIPFIAIERK